MNTVSLLLVLLGVGLVAAGPAKTLDAAGKQAALDAHNNYRRMAAEGKTTGGAGVLPQASNMNKLKYSTKLEEEGRKWLDSCPGMQHTPNINYGQNLCAFGPELPQPEALKKCVGMWHDDEVVKYPTQDVEFTDAVFNAGTGHFTQVIWAESTVVGCATAVCAGGRVPKN